jgi:hypothetical protein
MGKNDCLALIVFLKTINQLIVFEVKHKFLGTSGWELILARNTWFQKQVLQKLNKISSKINNSYLCLPLKGRK